MSVDFENLTQSEMRLRFFCLDCRADTHHQGIAEYYVVHDHLWRLVMGEPHSGMLCIGCFETRLGRRLVGGDFKDCPANFDQRASKRLMHRRQTEMSDVQRALRVVLNAIETNDMHLDLIVKEARKVS